MTFSENHDSSEIYESDFSQDFSSFDSINSINSPSDGCTQCGLCLPTCPTFKISGALSHSPMGRIQIFRNIERDDYQYSTSDHDALESCLICRSCESICPSQVAYVSLLDSAMQQLNGKRSKPFVIRMMMFLTDKPAFFRIMIALVKPTSPVIKLFRKYLKSNALKSVSHVFSYTKYTRVGLDKWSTNVPVSHNAPKVSLFTGCMSSIFDVPVLESTIKFLRRLGVDVVIPDRQTCCGALHGHNGEKSQAIDLAMRNIIAFSHDSKDTIISTASGCGQMLQDYGSYVGSNVDFQATSAGNFSSRVIDVSSYLLKSKILENAEFSPCNKIVAVHTPCTLKLDGEQSIATIKVLEKIPGLEMCYILENVTCCGAGGSHLLSHIENANEIRKDILSTLTELGADVLLTSNVGCALHLKEGIDARKMKIEVMHPVQLLEKYLKTTE